MPTVVPHFDSLLVELAVHRFELLVVQLEFSAEPIDLGQLDAALVAAALQERRNRIAAHRSVVPDPLLAVEDALRTFPADEIVVITGREERGAMDGEETLGRFGVPVRTISLTPADVDESRVAEAMRNLARGQRESTPFVAFFGVNALLLAFAALISLLVLLVLWLA